MSTIPSDQFPFIEIPPAAMPEPPPIQNEHPAVADMVAGDFAASGATGRRIIQDIMARKRFGAAKYGTPLQPFNGRNALMDLYQELLDGTKYAKLALYEAQHLGRDFRREKEIYEGCQTLLIRINNILEDRRASEARQGNQAGK